MDRHTSVYLDAARLFAALLVVAGHTEWYFAPGFLPFVRNDHLATLAVGIFFVLSGYVIGYAVDQKEWNPLNYFVNRAARIYSVVVLALVLTLALDTIGEWIEPGNYADSLSAIHFLKEAARELISLTFVNGVWQWNLTPGDNIAFWSLAYEVPYYVVFGLSYFGGTGCRVVAVALLFALGPYITILFGLWLFGMGCYYLCRSITMSPWQGSALLIVSATLLCVSPYFAGFFPEANPWGGVPMSLAQYYVAGVPFAGTIIGFRFAGLSLETVAPVVRWAAGATFTIYLMHVPFGMFLRGIMPSSWPLGIRWTGIYATVVILCFVGAQFSERKKEAWRLLFLQFMRRFYRQPSVTI